MSRLPEKNERERLLSVCTILNSAIAWGDKKQPNSGCLFLHCLNDSTWAPQHVICQWLQLNRWEQAAPRGLVIVQNAFNTSSIRLPAITSEVWWLTPPRQSWVVTDVIEWDQITLQLDYCYIVNDYLITFLIMSLKNDMFLKG